MRSPAAVSLTYALGRSLYVPLTCRCNTVTLPETRGPGFVLPRDVVISLVHLRTLELETASKGDKARHPSPEQCIEAADGKLFLPPNSAPRVSCLADQCESAITYKMLRDEINSKFVSAKRSGKQYDSLVIAGEGEPTLRLETLLEIARNPFETSCFGYTKPSIRVVTNGLGNSIQGNANCLSRMKEAGVDGLSVALMTASSSQYDELMQPCLSDSIPTPAHELVCDFIREAVDIGMNVEVTGSDRNDVDKGSAEELARRMGVTSPMRWRPFFL